MEQTGEEKILPEDKVMKVEIVVNKDNEGSTFKEYTTYVDGSIKMVNTNIVSPHHAFHLLAMDQWSEGKFDRYIIFEFNEEDPISFTEFKKSLLGSEDEFKDYCEWVISMENDPNYTIENACTLLNMLNSNPKKCLIDVSEPNQSLAVRYVYEQIEKNSGIKMVELNNSLMVMLGYEVKQNAQTFVYKKSNTAPILERNEMLFYALSVAISISIIKEDIISGSKHVNESMMENETEQVFEKYYPDYHIMGPGLLIKKMDEYYKSLIKTDSDRHSVYSVLTDSKLANKLTAQVKKMLENIPEGLTMGMKSIGDITSYLHSFPNMMYSQKMLSDPEYGISEDPTTITYIMSIILTRYLLKQTDIMDSGKSNNVPALMTGLLFAKTIADLNKYAHNPNNLQILLDRMDTEEVREQAKKQLIQDIDILNKNIDDEKDKLTYSEELLQQTLKERADIYRAQIKQFSSPTFVEQRNNTIKAMYKFLNTISRRCIEYTTDKPVPTDYNIADYLDIDISKLIYIPKEDDK